LQRLAEWALCAPGVVLGRALRRHWSHAVEGTGFAGTLTLSWSALRNYLDTPIFASLLMKRSGVKNYRAAIRRAVFDGNLESVLDEHFWMSRQSSHAETCKELSEALQVRSVTSLFRALPGVGESHVRCHAALPFTEARVQIRRGDDRPPEEKILRTDELRKAFNSPFWPHVLVTTSVGQEGLDFHVWCDALLHWDLPHNAVDLEQREGRIQRYAGRSIRRAIAAEDLALPTEGSPWQRLGEYAEAHMSDPSGLSPWWILPSATLSRLVFDVPMSEQGARLEQLHQDRLLYRLALGQPDPEDLVARLGQRGEPHSAPPVLLDLSPYFKKQSDETFIYLSEASATYSQVLNFARENARGVLEEAFNSATDLELVRLEQDPNGAEGDNIAVTEDLSTKRILSLLGKYDQYYAKLLQLKSITRTYASNYDDWYSNNKYFESWQTPVYNDLSWYNASNPPNTEIVAHAVLDTNFAYPLWLGLGQSVTKPVLPKYVPPSEVIPVDTAVGVVPTDSASATPITPDTASVDTSETKSYLTGQGSVLASWMVQDTTAKPVYTQDAIKKQLDTAKVVYFRKTFNITGNPQGG
ncbi:hypothetical protein EDM76_13310, partial [bacterium]